MTPLFFVIITALQGNARMTSGSRFVALGVSMFATSIFLGPALANDNLRSFVHANPGIDKSALRQMWQSGRNGGQDSIGFGVIGLNSDSGRSA